MYTLYTTLYNKHDPEKFMLAVLENGDYLCKARYLKNDYENRRKRGEIRPEDIFISIRTKHQKAVPLLVNLANPKYGIKECFALELPDQIVELDDVDEGLYRIRNGQKALIRIRQVLSDLFPDCVRN